MDKKDLDSFWDLGKIVPKKHAPLKQFSTEARVVDYCVKAEEQDNTDESKATEKKLTSVSLAPSVTQECTQTYDGKGLIRRVTLKKINEKYDFHAGFVKAAELYFDYYTHECDFAKLYSYMPQYSQLNKSQKDYYFYWRYQVRRKNYIRTDYSYLYLYVYEIINLPEKILPKEGIELLIDVWVAYRAALPNIDSYFYVWVQDYCLIHRIECPMERIKDFVFNIPSATGLKEFYLSDAALFGDSGINALLLYLSEYDWRCGRYAGGENREVYERHMLAAMHRVISELMEGNKLSFSTDSAVTERTAFRNALTSSGIKYRICVEYSSLSENPELRAIVTSAVKYTENKLRSLLGVKSRLSVKTLDDECKKAIDSYFSTVFDRVNQMRREAMRPEYEKQYDAESIGFSSKEAENIERASWITTARLTENSEDAEDVFIAVEEELAPNPGQNEEKCDFGLNSDEIEFLSLILNDRIPDADRIALESGLDSTSFVDRINEAFADFFGDVVIEECDAGYKIIEDYREDVSNWLQKTQK